MNKKGADQIRISSHIIDIKHGFLLALGFELQSHSKQNIATSPTPSPPNFIIFSQRKRTKKLIKLRNWLFNVQFVEREGLRLCLAFFGLAANILSWFASEELSCIAIILSKGADQPSKLCKMVCTFVVCLIWFFTSHQQSFSYVGKGLPELNQY